MTLRQKQLEEIAAAINMYSNIVSVSQKTSQEMMMEYRLQIEKEKQIREEKINKEREEFELRLRSEHEKELTRLKDELNQKKEQEEALIKLNQFEYHKKKAQENEEKSKQEKKLILSKYQEAEIAKQEALDRERMTQKSKMNARREEKRRKSVLIRGDSNDSIESPRMESPRMGHRRTGIILQKGDSSVLENTIPENEILLKQQGQVSDNNKSNLIEPPSIPPQLVKSIHDMEDKLSRIDHMMKSLESNLQIQQQQQHQQQQQLLQQVFQQQQNQQQQQQQIFQRNNSSHFFPEGFNPSKNSGSNYAQHVQHFQQHQQQQNQSQQQQQQQHHHHQQQQQQTQPQHHHQHQQQQQQYLYLDSQSLSRVFQPEKPDIIPSSRQPFASTSIGSIGQMYEPDEEKPLHPQQQQLQLQQQHQHQQQSQQSQSTIWTSTSTPATLPSVSISTHYETVHEEPRVSKRRPSGGSQRHLFTSLVLPEPSPRSIGRGFSFASSRSDFPSFETTTDTSSVSLGTPDGRSFRNRQSFFPMTRSSEGFTSGEYSDTEYKLQRTTSPPILLDPPSSSLSSSRQTNTINRNMEGNR